MFPTLAQAAPSPLPISTGTSASNIFYLTLLFIFLTGIVTALVTKWAKDKCLKLFHGYHVTVERLRGQTIWGTLRVFSSGLEVVYDHAFPDHRGRRKTSYLLYQQEVEQQTLSIFRYPAELNERAQRARQRQVQRTFNPGPIRRFTRAIRNLVNTLRDAFSASIGAVIGQYQRMNPASMVLGTQGTQVTQIGQTLLSRFANAYEPLLDRYIGQPVFLQVADPINPNNETSEYSGFLAGYTQQYIAVFAVQNEVCASHTITLPDLDHGDFLPPLPAPPIPGAPRIELPPPMLVEHGIAVRMDGRRMKLQNTGYLPVVLRKFEREGFQPFPMGLTVPPNATVEMPAASARGARITFDIVNQVDIVAPRKFATVRHAGQLVERRGLADELHINQIPLVPLLFGGRNGKQDVDDEQAQSEDERARME